MRTSGLDTEDFAPSAPIAFDLPREGEQVCRINLAVPAGAPPAGGWPVIVLLDAAGCFGTCVEALGRMSRRSDATAVVPMVVVGVSAGRGEYDRARRQADFTSPVPDQPRAGGAAAFLRFLTDEVLPAVAAQAPIDRSRATLFGHSLAGYFVLWVLANAPGTFRNHAAISPSTWWDRTGLHAAIDRLPAGCAARALVCIGEWEDDLPPWQQTTPGATEARARRLARQMVPGARAVAEALAQVLGEAQVSFRLLAEEDHASILSAAIPRALRLASLPA